MVYMGQRMYHYRGHREQELVTSVSLRNRGRDEKMESPFSLLTYFCLFIQAYAIRVSDTLLFQESTLPYHIPMHNLTSL